ncbi:MAG: undecaprenyl diphosphate synthase family protein, partial [Acidobacteriaceae bacterium]
MESSEVNRASADFAVQSRAAAGNGFAVQSETGQGLHVAIIMDGNGRWAARRGLPRLAGHRAG